MQGTKIKIAPMAATPDGQSKPEPIMAAPDLHHVSHRLKYGKGEGQRRRRKWRLFVLFALLLLSFATHVIVGTVLRSHLVYEWDTVQDLSIQVRGCDIRVLPADNGSAASITIDRQAAGRTSASVTWSDAGNKIVGATIQNFGGCVARQRSLCAPLCLVTVRVPSVPSAGPGATTATNGTYGAQGVRIAQDDDDQAVQITITVSSVSVADLRVQGPSAVAAFTGVRANMLAVQSIRGSAMLMDTTFGSADLRVLQGSVIVRHTVCPAAAYKVQYRATQNGVCFAGGANTELTPTPAWSNNADARIGGEVSIDPTDASEGAEWWRQRVREHYDDNMDGFVTKAELRDGIARLPKCCGTACPIKSNCYAKEQQIFGALSAVSANDTQSEETGILNSAVFMQRLAAMNDTSMVPSATSTMFAACSFPRPSTSLIPLTMVTNSGELRIELEEAEKLAFGNNSSHRIARITPNIVLGTWFEPAEKQRGLRLIAADSARLMLVRDRVGKMDSTDDIFLVIDVVASPGVPESRYIYTTKPLFLHVDPAYLRFMSAGLLSPPVVHERVRIRNGYCGHNGTSVLTPARMAARRAEIYVRLLQSLVPEAQLRDPKQPEMRGVLVRLREDHQPAPARQSIESWCSTCGASATSLSSFEGWIAVDFVGGRHDMALTAVYLSLILAFLIASAALNIITKFVSGKLKRKIKADAIKAKLLRTDEAAKTVAQGKRKINSKRRNKSAQKDQSARNASPFRMPLELISLLVIAPLRKRFVNSLTKFLNERCEHIDNAVGGSEQDLAISMDFEEFMKEYTKFCYRFDLHEITSFSDVQTHLREKHNIAIHTKNVDRITGVRWKQVSEYEPAIITAMDSDDVKSVVNAFLDAHAVVTQKVSDKVSWYEAPVKDKVEPVLQDDGPSTYAGPEFGGFVTRFNMFCEANGVNVDDDDACRILDGRGMERSTIKQHNLVNVRFKAFHAGDRAKLSWRWYLIEAVTVVAHCCFLLIPAILTIAYCLTTLQYAYCETMSTTPECLTMWDLVQWPPTVQGKDTMLIIDIVCVTMFVIMGLTCVRLALHYAQFMSPQTESAVQWCYQIILELCLFGFLWFCSIVFVWLVLAAMLDPSKYLAFGVGITTVVAMATSTWKRMMAAARRLRTKVLGAFKSKVGMAVMHAQKVAIETARIKRLKRPNGSGTKSFGLRRRSPATSQTGPNSSPRKSQGGLGQGNDEQSRGVESTQGSGCPNVSLFSLKHASLSVDDLRRTSASVARRTSVSMASQGLGHLQGKVPSAIMHNFDPSDLFNLLDDNDNGVLHKEEFESLFDRLQIDVSEQQKKQMFAHCDTDADGLISQQEFLDAWKWLEEKLVSDAAGDMGLSDGSAIVTVGTMVLMLTLLFAFIFVALKGWKDSGSFESTVQSMFLSFSGVAAHFSRKASKGEVAEKEDLEKAAVRVTGAAVLQEA